MRRASSIVVAVAALALGTAAAAAPREGGAGAIRSGVDVEAAQAILAVQSLDGWLLAGGGQNAIATELVAPSGSPTRAWFYFIPARGQPTLLCHAAETSSFELAPGGKRTYAGYDDLKRELRALLGGAKRVAMEHAPDSKIASLSRLDAGTVSLVRSTGVAIASSAELVQFTKALWGPEGRVAHYLAMHHLERAIAAALGFLAAERTAGRPVTELGLQTWLRADLATRGVDGPAPIVAAGPHTADPLYAPTPRTDRAIEAGDVVLLDVAGRVADAERPIYARLGWVAYVGASVPSALADEFGRLVAARDAALELLRDRARKRRPIKGYEVDRAVRAALAAAGAGDVLHRTGHSLDTSLYGDGANLDDADPRDTRSLVIGSGFTLGPGVYRRGRYGLRTVTAVYLGRTAVERTGPAQRAIAIVAGP
jgi:Xaa-Pro aminopeptidase